MQTIRALSALVFCLASQACSAQTTQPAMASPEADQWLTRIEQAADKTHTLTARIVYERVQGLLGDEQRRTGVLMYDAGPPARFRVDFTHLIAGNAGRPQQRSWVFDGRWLAEIDGDEKTFIRRELIPKDQQGEELLGMDSNPFVVPLDFDKSTLMQRFDIQLIPDPDGLIHLQLIPKDGIKIEEKQIDLWYDPDTLQPVRAEAVDNAENTTSLVLRNVEVNGEIGDKDFDTAPPREAGWSVEIVPLDR